MTSDAPDTARNDAPQADLPAAAAPVGSRLLALVLTAGGASGGLAAFMLAVEKIAVLKNPSHIPSCSINPVLSCGSVMNTAQAEAFGFPNPLLGIVGFAVVTTIGVVVLSGAVLSRWFWLGLQAGTVFGVAFVHWLIFQSLYRINALCPYCMAVWAVMIPIFWYVTVYNVSRRNLPVPARMDRVAAMVTDYHGVVLTAWYLTVVALIGQRFWPYWSTLV